MQDREIENLIYALEQNETQLVNDYLRLKWKEGSHIFIDTITKMRSKNSDVVDRYFNTHESLMHFIK